MRNIRGGKERNINLKWVTFMFKDDNGQFVILSNPGLNVRAEWVPVFDDSQGRDCQYYPIDLEYSEEN